MPATRTRPSPAAVPPAPSAADWATDWTRQQMVVANEGACALFRGFQAMRGIQERAAQQATQRHAAALERLRQARTPVDLLAVQGEVLRSDLEGATRYWQELAGAALEMNTELAGCAAHLVDTEDVFGAPGMRLLHYA